MIKMTHQINNKSVESAQAPPVLCISRLYETKGAPQNSLTITLLNDLSN